MEKDSADYGQVNGDDNQQQTANTTITEDDVDILSMTLPLWPDSNISNKNLSWEQSIKNIIIIAIINNGITGDAYSVGANDGRQANMIYFSLKEFASDLAPVIVEIQNKVNHAFVARTIRYCLNIFDDVKALPALTVISMDGFSSKKEFRGLAFDKLDGHPFYTYPCRSWAKQAQAYSAGSITKHIDASPIDPMIALAYILIRQDKNIVMLDEYDDPMIQ